jgi:hypothetical protein
VLGEELDTAVLILAEVCTLTTNNKLRNTMVASKNTRDAPDIRPDNPAFFDIRSDTRLPCRISGKARYPANVKLIQKFL